MSNPHDVEPDPLSDMGEGEPIGYERPAIEYWNAIEGALRGTGGVFDPLFAVAQLKRKLEERDRLRKNLDTYGIHLAGCASHYTIDGERDQSRAPCDCGLAAALGEEAVSDQRTEELVAVLHTPVLWGSAQSEALDELAQRAAKRDRLREKLDRAVYLAERLHQMIPQQAWRDSGGDDGHGHYEGDYHAEQIATELKALGETP